VASSTNTTLTGTKSDGTSPAWTVDALKELYVYAISDDGTTIQRRRITANTANVLTVDVAWSTNPNSTYTFVIGGIDFQWDTAWNTAETPFYKKRLEFLFAQFTSEDSEVVATVELFLDYDAVGPQRTFNIDVSGDAAVYDASSSLYDSSRFALSIQTDARKRVGKTAKAWRVRVRNIQPDKDLVLMKLAMQSVLLTTKR
jgi:hypothetical protein